MSYDPNLNQNQPNMYQYNPSYQNVPHVHQAPAGKKRVSKIAYILLALFLGGFGIHNFYAGKVGLGILYLVMSWTFIPAFAALIQAILAIFKPSDCCGCIYV